MKQEKSEVHKEDNLLEFISDKCLKKTHSEHTSFAFRSEENLFIVGYIRGYLNIKDSSSKISEEFEFMTRKLLK